MNAYMEEDVVIEAKLALAEQPVIVATLSILPKRWLPMVETALILAYAHGYVAQQMDRVQGSTH